MKKQKIITLLAVIAIGGLNAAPAKAFGFKRNRLRQYDTPKTLQLKDHIRALQGQKGQLKEKRNRIDDAIDSVVATIDRKEDQIKAIYREQEADAKRKADEEANQYRVDRIDLNDYDDNSSARLYQDQVRTQAMADYVYGETHTKPNEFLVSEKEYNRRFKKPAGVYYEGGS